MQRKVRITRNCRLCNKSFSTYKCWAKNERHGRYCSKICAEAHRTTPLSERFKRSVGEKTENGCMLWKGAVVRGRGVLMSKNAEGEWKQVKAYRVAYELTHGPIPKGLFVCHRCDNPLCVNAAHLFVGTAGDNTRDAAAKGRLNPAKGEDCIYAKLTESDVLTIRERYARGGVSQITLAREFGTTQGNIRLILLRKTWKHI